MEPRSWNRSVVIQEILHLVENSPPELLAEAQIQRRQPDLHRAAGELFGDWSMALVHALKDTLTKRKKASRWAPTGVERRPPKPRIPHPDAMRPVYVSTEEAYIVQLRGDAFTASEVRTAPNFLKNWSEFFGIPTMLRDIGPASMIVGISEDGRALAFDVRRVPFAELGGGARHLGESHQIKRWISILNLERFQQRDLFVHATRFGKVKCASTKSFPSLPDENGAQVFGLEEGDRAICAWAANEIDVLLLVASTGNVIAISLRDLPTTKMRSTGLRGIQLKGGRVVDGVLATHSLEIALLTRKGHGLRVLSDEFHPQSPGGRGVSAIRLDEDDEVVAVVPCSTSTDLAMMTSRGRALRIPVPALPLRVRGASGERVIDLEDDEQLIGTCRMLPMKFSDNSPMAFEV